MAAGKKSAAELRAENRLLRQANVAQAVASIVNNLIRWGAVTLWFYFGYLAVDSLAGKETIANIFVNFIANLTVSKALAYALGGGGIIYGVAERRLRQRTVARLQARNQELEKKRDPKRTSSRLTPRGETNPQDAE